MKSWLAICVVGVALCSCATAYQSEGLTGGFADHPGPGKLETVYFSGNGNTPAGVAQKYVLYRCAEISRDKGAPYFVIYDSLNAAIFSQPDNMPRVGVVQGKPVSYTFVLPLNAKRDGAKETAAVLRELDRDVHGAPN